MTPEASRATAALLKELSAELLDHLADVIADRVAERLQQAPDSRQRDEGLLDAKEVARRCGRSRDWVYGHADDLGAVRLGDLGPGKRPRLAFRADSVEGFLGARSATLEEDPRLATVPARRRPRGTRPAGDVELLPIRGAGA